MLYPRCCGVDGQQATVVACVRLPSTGRRRTSAVQTLETTTRALWQLADWLTEQGVTPVAIERTGVYWRPVFNVLEGSFEGILGNARHCKAVPGRQTDGKDAAWLAQLLAHGLLRASCIPPRPIRELRELTRSRTTLLQARASELNRIHRRLESATIQLGLGATAILGASGRAMRRALVAGERDGGARADLAKGVLRHKRSRLGEALPGRFSAPHAVRLGELLAHLEDLEGAIARLRERIATALGPYAAQVERLPQMPGISCEAAERVLAEVGVDGGRFPSAAHLASGAGVCPGHHASAGTRKTGRTRQGHPWLKTLVVECGWGAGRARRTDLGAQYVRLLRRRGAKNAALAVGHSIWVAVYDRLRDGVADQDLGPEHCDRVAAERLTRHDVHRLQQLGHRVTLAPEPDVA